MGGKTEYQLNCSYRYQARIYFRSWLYLCYL